MTPLPCIYHTPIVPAGGFRWLRLEPVWSDDEPKLKYRHIPEEPPADWPDADYEAYTTGNFPDDHILTIHRYVLAASYAECLAQRETEGQKVVASANEPGLYLEFASARPTPAQIRTWANRHGLLNYKSAAIMKVSIEGEDARALAAHFPLEGRDKLTLLIEHPGYWLQAHIDVWRLLAGWSEMASGTSTERGEFLEFYNQWMTDSLKFEVTVDPATGEARSEVHAASLQHLVMIQWGMSIAASVEHRQCMECTAWFAVHPGAGRPEKLYCSDACRMRAYRKRKAVSQTVVRKKRK